MAFRTEPSPNRIIRSRHDSLMVLTKRSAWALRLGDRGQLHRLHAAALQDLQKFSGEQGIPVMNQISLTDQEALRSVTRFRATWLIQSPLPSRVTPAI